jgi:hypothetical protein
VPRVSPEPSELTAEELAEEQAVDLPDREALSIVDPGVFSTLPIPVAGRGAPTSDTTEGVANVE